MTRRPIRDFISINDVLENEPGWYELILYDADFATKQMYLETYDMARNYLYLIYPLVIEASR